MGKQSRASAARTGRCPGRLETRGKMPPHRPSEQGGWPRRRGVRMARKSPTRGEAQMTENYPPAATPSQRGESRPPVWAEEQGTADVVKDQASDLGHSSVQAGKHVADVAREQASGVAAEAGRQGRDLLQQAQGQLE